MTWLQVKDDCKTAEEVMRRVMDIGKRPWKQNVVEPKPKIMSQPKPKPKPVLDPADILCVDVAGFKHGKLREILVQTSRHFNVSIPHILSDVRFRAVALPRQVAYYLSKKLTTSSYNEIAKHYGRDHTSVIKGVRHIQSILHSQNDKIIVYGVAKIAENLRDGRFGFRPLPDETKMNLNVKQDNRNKYTQEDIDRIKNLRMGGVTEREIAKITGRSRQAIISKLSRMTKNGVFAQ